VIITPSKNTKSRLRRGSNRLSAGAVEEMQRIHLMTEGRNDGIQQAFDAELSGREQLHERVP